MPRIFLAALTLVLPLAAQEGEPHKVHEQGVTQPVIIHKVNPKYTKEARKAKIEGTVQLAIVISREGRAEDGIKVAESLDPGLDANAIAAVQAWRFKPATKGGEPVRVYATVEVTFHLDHP
jgi:protein TonB